MQLHQPPYPSQTPKDGHANIPQSQSKFQEIQSKFL